MLHKPEPHYTPKNLLDYIQEKVNDNLISLLAKHYANLNKIINSKIKNPKINDALFIIELNGFGNDLVKIAKIYAEIDLEECNHQKNIETLQKYKSKEISKNIESFYTDARNYDNDNHHKNQIWLPKNSNPLHHNPFRHDSKLSNEENIFNLIKEFRNHNDYFKNYLNTFYGDHKKGEEFLDKTFEAVASDYKKIKDTIEEISKTIPKDAPEKILRTIESKQKYVNSILAKYPATLYLATKAILDHLENAKNEKRPASI